MALAAIQLGDVLDGEDHSPLFRQWVATARQKLVYAQTGLLVSSFTADGRHLDGEMGIIGQDRLACRGEFSGNCPGVRADTVALGTERRVKQGHVLLQRIQQCGRNDGRLECLGLAAGRWSSIAQLIHDNRVVGRIGGEELVDLLWRECLQQDGTLKDGDVLVIRHG